MVEFWYSVGFVSLRHELCQTQGPFLCGPEEFAKNIIYNTIGVIVECMLSMIFPRRVLSDIVIYEVTTGTDNNHI